MSIRSRIEDAIALYNLGRYEGAVLSALIAVAATSKKESENKNDRECFEAFLNTRWRGVLQIEFRGQLHTLPHILYKWFRCELVHEGQIPFDVELIDSDAMSIRAGGSPGFTLQLSRGWFRWLLDAVIEAPSNNEVFSDFVYEISADSPEYRKQAIIAAAGSISHEDCEAMKRAIEEDCNTIWLEEWEKPIFPES